MNWNKIALEKLESLYTALGVYLKIRRQKDAARKITEIEKERQRVSLELFETRAQLSANQEMVGRLMSSLKISPNGHNARPGPLPKPSRPEPTTAAEDAPLGLTLDEAAAGTEDAPAGLTLDEAAAGTEDAPAGLTLDEFMASTEDAPIGLTLDELNFLNIGEWGS